MYCYYPLSLGLATPVRSFPLAFLNLMYWWITHNNTTNPAQLYSWVYTQSSSLLLLIMLYQLNSANELFINMHCHHNIFLPYFSWPVYSWLHTSHHCLTSLYYGIKLYAGVTRKYSSKPSNAQYYKYCTLYIIRLCVTMMTVCISYKSKLSYLLEDIAHFTHHTLLLTWFWETPVSIR